MCRQLGIMATSRMVGSRRPLWASAIAGIAGLPLASRWALSLPRCFTIRPPTHHHPHHPLTTRLARPHARPHSLTAPRRSLIMCVCSLALRRLHPGQPVGCRPPALAFTVACVWPVPVPGLVVLSRLGASRCSPYPLAHPLAHPLASQPVRRDIPCPTPALSTRQDARQNNITQEGQPRTCCSVRGMCSHARTDTPTAGHDTVLPPREGQAQHGNSQHGLRSTQHGARSTQHTAAAQRSAAQHNHRADDDLSHAKNGPPA